METELAGSLQQSFAYDFIKTEVNKNTQATTVSTSQKQYVISSMSIERFYASVREEESPLAPEAISLLDKQDYVGFFMACGSNYVRSIRRKQEVTTVFMFESSSVELAQEFASSLRTTGGEEDTSEKQTTKSKFDSISNSLQIKILGYGLGLNQEGSGTLVAQSLKEFKEVMKFAFRAMTQSGGGSVEIGMVFGVEVVPWVDNVQFQVNAKVQDLSIEVPLSRSLIPRAYNSTNRADKDFTNDDEHRAAFICQEPAYVIDMYGYCCELNALYDPYNAVYNPYNENQRVCKPLRVLDKSIVKNNMANNGEFVVRLDQVIRNKLNMFSTLEKCMSDVTAIESRFDNMALNQRATATYDSNIFATFSVLELKMALDPFKDYAVQKFLGYELDEYMEMYYQRCLAAMFGSGGSDTDASFFMANPWTSHPECMHMSCLSPSNRWARDGSGCVPGILAGKGATPYAEDDTYCAKDPDSDGATETCKHTTEYLTEFYTDTVGCWESMFSDSTNPAIEYMMNNFCMPSISSVALSTGDFSVIQSRSQSCVKTGTYR